MRKNLSYLCLICLLCSVIGCSSQEVELFSMESQENSADREYAITIAMKEEIVDSKGKVFESLKQMLQQSKGTNSEDVFLVEKHNYSEKNISIDYPQISYPDNPDTERQINEKLYNVFISLFKDNWDWDNLSVEANYQVMLNGENCLSFLCKSEVCVWESAHPSKFYFGVNLDTRTGRFISLEDELDIDVFRRMIKDRNYTVTPNFVAEELSLDHFAEITNYHSIIFNDEPNLHTYYVTPESICVLISISHAYGDIAIIHIPQG